MDRHPGPSRAGERLAGRDCLPLPEGDAEGAGHGERGRLVDPGGDGLVPGTSGGDVSPSPYPLVGGAAVGAADARASAEEQRPVRAVAGNAGPEGDYGDLLAVPGAVVVPDAPVAGLAAPTCPAPAIVPR